MQTIPLHQPARGQDETFSHYKDRRALSNRTVKVILEGTVLVNHRASAAKRARRALVKKHGVRQLKRRGSRLSA